VWVFDPVARQTHLFAAGQSPRRWRDHETLSDPESLPGFQMRVEDAFAEPKWDLP
jgi:hypothetical protein